MPHLPALALLEDGKPACLGRRHAPSQEGMKLGSGCQSQAGACLPSFPGVGAVAPRKGLSHPPLAAGNPASLGNAAGLSSWTPEADPKVTVLGTGPWKARLICGAAHHPCLPLAFLESRSWGTEL